jgi:phenylacetate-CoA ligase
MGMAVAEHLRSLGFWTLDRLRGGPVRRHLRDLERLRDDPRLVARRQTERLEKLLAHACETTPYYRQFSGATKLRDLPVLLKRTIRERHAEFFSSSYDRDSLLPRLTSGSYGTPLAFYITRDKFIRHQAEVIYHAQWVGYRLGARTAQTRARKPKGPVGLFMQNLVMMNPTHLTEEWLAEQRRLLRQQRVEMLVGYPSALAAIAAHCRAAGDTPSDFSLRVLIAMAEPLREDTREMIETTFGCPAYSRYATEECGVLAQECPGARQHHLNQATFVFEVLDRARDAPAAPGELGRVVVTDLWSQAMPLIRYDLGDLAVMEEQCACGWPGPVLTCIEGRAVETVYDTAGQGISPFAINARVKDLDNILQLQFVQHAPARYTMRLHTMPAFDQEGLLKERLLSLVGADAELSFEYVDEIPPLASGKRPYIVNEMESPPRAPAP